MTNRKKIGLVAKTGNEQLDDIQINTIKSYQLVEEIVFIDMEDLISKETEVRDTFMVLLESCEIYTTLPKRLIDPIGVYHNIIHVVHCL